MTTFKRTKALSILLSLVMLFGMFSVFSTSVLAADSAFTEGTYAAVVEKAAMGNTSTYTIKVVFSGGSYAYDVNVNLPAMEYNEDDETQTGTYIVNGDTLTFDGGNLSSAKVIDAETLELTGYQSSFAKMSGESTFQVKKVTFEDTLVSGTYALTADSYDPSAGMKMAADLIVDTEAKTFELWRTMASGAYTKRSEGAISFDENTGVYTIAFTNPADKTTTFIYDAATKGMTFTSPLWFGMVAMNTMDDDGNFLTYTAFPKVYEDTLASGTYALTADSYDPSAGMKMAADLIVDTEAKTFELWRTMASGAYTKRSEGAISFDENTGIYTIAFTNPADKTTTFTYDAATKGMTFTSPLWFGMVAMNTMDDDGNFLTYTAFPKTDAVTPVSIAVNSDTHKTAYNVGDALNVENLTILVTYSDGTTETVAVSADMVAGFDSAEAADAQTLAIVYEGLTCTFTVSVAASGAETPAQPEQEQGADNSANLCKFCHKQHTGFFGKITQFFHNIFYFFQNMFRK